MKTKNPNPNKDTRQLLLADGNHNATNFEYFYFRFHSSPQDKWGLEKICLQLTRKNQRGIKIKNTRQF
ncbi:hypothetical protein DERF_013504 [Dermatophagoides farinae]|uniref:Uncharacterized protein n=1 Tax=Dermatophagoides farinae TaxID=6954 RepID=A0A922HQB1_DERFA|nr:hypothetical protein DERF_013504 [Dermatophagoides farinae]